MMAIEVIIYISISILVMTIALYFTYKKGRKFEEVLSKVDRYFAYFLVIFIAVIGFLWAILEG
jgi:predicted RND superfamily exporter protein